MKYPLLTKEQRRAVIEIGQRARVSLVDLQGPEAIVPRDRLELLLATIADHVVQTLDEDDEDRGQDEGPTDRQIEDAMDPRYRLPTPQENSDLKREARR